MQLLAKPFAFALGLAAICLFAPAPASAAPVETVRYDLATAPLNFFGLELHQDFIFPPEPVQIVETRFVLTFDSTAGGVTPDYDAADVGLALQAPVPDPTHPSGLATAFFTGSDFGWSGSGTFTFDAAVSGLDGPVLIPPPGTTFLLYGVTYFHAGRLDDPNDLTPLGGQYLDSYIELSYTAVPEPASLGMVGLGLLLLRRRR